MRNKMRKEKETYAVASSEEQINGVKAMRPKLRGPLEEQTEGRNQPVRAIWGHHGPKQVGKPS